MRSSLLDDPDFAPAGAAREKAINPLIQAELVDGERLVWVGQPRRQPGALPSGYRILFVVPGIFLGALGLIGAIFLLSDWLDGSLTSGVPSLLMLALEPVAVGLIVIGLRDWLGLSRSGAGGRPSVDPLRRWFDRRVEGSFYALTDRRVILWEPYALSDLRVRSFRAADFTGISRTQRADGSGDLSLEILAPLPTGGAGMTVLARLGCIDDVRAVEALIRATLGHA